MLLGFARTPINKTHFIMLLPIPCRGDIHTDLPFMSITNVYGKGNLNCSVTRINLTKLLYPFQKN